MRRLVDHREERIDDMAGPGDEREAPGRERGDERHLLRVGADHPCRDADEDFRPPGRLEHRCGGDDREDNQEDIDRWRRGDNAEAGREHKQPHRSPQAQADAAGARPDPDRHGDDEELEHDVNRHADPSGSPDISPLRPTGEARSRSSKPRRPSPCGAPFTSRRTSDTGHTRTAPRRDKSDWPACRRTGG